MEEYGEYFENLGIGFDIDAYVIPGENIPVKVLYDDDIIVVRHLETYDLDIPNFEKVRKIWVWHSEEGDNTCDECASRDGKIYESEDDIPSTPVHPNCRCSLTEDVIDPDGRTLGSKPYKPKTQPNNNETQKGTKEMTKDEKFEEAYNKLKEPEGGYTDGKNQVRDEPTNMGIKQSSLDNYAKQHPEKDLPSDVKDLEPSQAKEIYKEVYWNNTKIPQIENNRVRNAVFDMGVMSGPISPTKTLQKTLNEQMAANLPLTGYLGDQTIKVINSIPENKIDNFMNALIENRLQSLQEMKNWPTAKNGWTKRTRAY